MLRERRRRFPPGGRPARFAGDFESIAAAVEDRPGRAPPLERRARAAVCRHAPPVGARSAAPLVAVSSLPATFSPARLSSSRATISRWSLRPDRAAEATTGRRSRSDMRSRKREGLGLPAKTAEPNVAEGRYQLDAWDILPRISPFGSATRHGHESRRVLLVLVALGVVATAGIGRRCGRGAPLRQRLAAFSRSRNRLRARESGHVFPERERRANCRGSNISVIKSGVS